jgi:hypothetical protein
MLVSCFLFVLLFNLEDGNKNSVVLVRQRIIPIERSPPVSEDSANFSG